mmetsp:Transcript_24220/g.68173  ORF Transcript_24220/g.68173 Transcript_24220/m.68173 type:complete len:293 (-) Transcript_24220:3-881(-)
MAIRDNHRSRHMHVASAHFSVGRSWSTGGLQNGASPAGTGSAQGAVREAWNSHSGRAEGIRGSDEGRLQEVRSQAIRRHDGSVDPGADVPWDVLWHEEDARAVPRGAFDRRFAMVHRSDLGRSNLHPAIDLRRFIPRNHRGRERTDGRRQSEIRTDNCECVPCHGRHHGPRYHHIPSHHALLLGAEQHPDHDPVHHVAQCLGQKAVWNMGSSEAGARFDSGPWIPRNDEQSGQAGKGRTDDGSPEDEGAQRRDRNPEACKAAQSIREGTEKSCCSLLPSKKVGSHVPVYMLV